MARQAITVDRETLNAACRTLDRLARGEYALSLEETLLLKDQKLAFRRIARLFGVFAKEPFARSFSYDLDNPGNWAKSSRFWEIRETPPVRLIRKHELQYCLLEDVAHEWHRPIDRVAEFNIAISLCRWFQPVVCGEAKALEDQEGIAKEFQKSGFGITPFSLGQGLGAAAISIASCLVQGVPSLLAHEPIIAGTTLLLMCMGQRKLCHLMGQFEKSYDRKKDRFATHVFYVCGSTSTKAGRPCEALVKRAGSRCPRHSRKKPADDKI